MRPVLVRRQASLRQYSMTDPKRLCRVLVVCALALTGCSDKNSSQVTAAIEAAKRDTRVEQLDVQPYVDRKITKICIQGPYNPKEFFEERVKQKVSDFSMVDDGFNVVWFFLSDGTHFQVKIDRGMDRSGKSSGCSPSSKLFFERNGSDTKFFILEE